MGAAVPLAREPDYSLNSVPGNKHAPRRLRHGGGSTHELRLVPIESLRPTQMAVGMRSVAYKRRKIEVKRSRRKPDRKILGARPIPAIRGPGGELFIIDHHHFGLALWHAAFKNALTLIIGDLSPLPADQFWAEMERTGRLYPFDELGRRVTPDEIPNWLHGLRHDPYRDLAWQVREAGGFRKVGIPYAEFQWGNFYREHIALNLLRWEPDRAFAHAMDLSRTNDASALPGFVGQ